MVRSFLRFILFVCKFLSLYVPDCFFVFLIFEAQANLKILLNVIQRIVSGNTYFPC